MSPEPDDKGPLGSLISAAQGLYPPDLQDALQLGKDYELTAELDKGKLAQKAKVPADEIADYAVRGDGQVGRVVTFVVIDPEDGRTSKGFFPYEDIVGKVAAKKADQSGGGSSTGGGESGAKSRGGSSGSSSGGSRKRSRSRAKSSKRGGS